MKRKRSLFTVAAFVGAVALLWGAEFRYSYRDGNRPAVAPTQQQAKARPDFILLPKPGDAPALAVTHLKTIPAAFHVFQRFVWVRSGSPEEKQIIDLAANY